MTVEIVGAMVAVRGGGEVGEYSAEAVLVRSACRTLLNAPRGLIDAMTVSLPVGDATRRPDLEALCRRLATEHRLRADLAVSETHLRARFTRPALEQVGDPR